MLVAQYTHIVCTRDSSCQSLDWSCYICLPHHNWLHNLLHMQCSRTDGMHTCQCIQNVQSSVSTNMARTPYFKLASLDHWTILHCIFVSSLNHCIACVNSQYLTVTRPDAVHHLLSASSSNDKSNQVICQALTIRSNSHHVLWQHGPHNLLLRVVCIPQCFRTLCHWTFSLMVSLFVSSVWRSMHCYVVIRKHSPTLCVFAVWTHRTV